METERDEMLRPGQASSPVALLMRLKGIGPEFAAVLYLEGLFRQFENRRQLAAYAGLAPSPWKSGSVDHEQGISKAGNPRLRTTMVELAWMCVNQHRTGTPFEIEATFLIPRQKSAFWWGPRRRRSGPPVQWIPDIVSRS
jgi:transposase